VPKRRLRAENKLPPLWRYNFFLQIVNGELPAEKMAFESMKKPLSALSLLTFS